MSFFLHFWVVHEKVFLTKILKLHSSFNFYPFCLIFTLFQLVSSWLWTICQFILMVSAYFISHHLCLSFSQGREIYIIWKKRRKIIGTASLLCFVLLGSIVNTLIDVSHKFYWTIIVHHSDDHNYTFISSTFTAYFTACNANLCRHYDFYRKLIYSILYNSIILLLLHSTYTNKFFALLPEIYFVLVYVHVLLLNLISHNLFLFSKTPNLLKLIKSQIWLHVFFNIKSLKSVFKTKFCSKIIQKFVSFSFIGLLAGSEWFCLLKCFNNFLLQLFCQKVVTCNIYLFCMRLVDVWLHIRKPMISSQLWLLFDGTFFYVLSC